MKTLRLLFLLCFTITGAFAQNTGNDGKMTFQGSLFQNGEPVNGNVELTFSIPLSNGEWTETISGVSVANGLYSVVLGNNNPLPNDLFIDATQRSVTVTVDGTALGQVNIYPSFVPGIIKVDSLLSNRLIIENDQGNYVEVTNNFYRIRNRSEGASSVYLTNGGTSRLQLADFDSLGATRSLSFFTARPDGTSNITMERFSDAGDRNLLLELYSTDRFIDGTVLRDGYARGGVDFYNNRGEQTSWFTSMPGDENGGDPDGWSAGMGLYGTNSINFTMEGKKWENNDLGSFQMYGEHTDGNGWYNRNFAVNVNSDGTNNWSSFEMFNTVEGANGETRTVDFDGATGNAYFAGDLTVDGTINSSIAPSVPDGGSLAINDSGGSQTVNLNGENGTLDIGGSNNGVFGSNAINLKNSTDGATIADLYVWTDGTQLNLKGHDGNTGITGGGVSLGTKWFEGQDQLGYFHLRGVPAGPDGAAYFDTPLKFTMEAIIDGNERAEFLMYGNELDVDSKAIPVLSMESTFEGASAWGSDLSLYRTEAGAQALMINMNSLGFLDIKGNAGSPNIGMGGRFWEGNSDLAYFNLTGSVQIDDGNGPYYPTAMNMNVNNDGTEQWANMAFDIQASDGSYGRPMALLNYDDLTGTGFLEFYSQTDDINGNFGNNARFGVDGGGMGYLELKGDGGEYFRVDANGIGGSPDFSGQTVTSDGYSLSNGKADIFSSDAGNGEFGNMELQAPSGSDDRIDMGFAGTNDQYGFISIWKNNGGGTDEYSLMNVVENGPGGALYGSLFLKDDLGNSVAVNGYGDVDATGNISAASGYISGDLTVDGNLNANINPNFDGTSVNSAGLNIFGEFSRMNIWNSSDSSYQVVEAFEENNYGIIDLRDENGNVSISLQGSTGAASYIAGDLTVDGNLNANIDPSVGDNDQGVLLDNQSVNFVRGGDGSGNGDLVVSLNSFDDGAGSDWGALDLNRDGVNVIRMNAENADVSFNKDGENMYIFPSGINAGVNPYDRGYVINMDVTGGPLMEMYSGGSQTININGDAGSINGNSVSANSIATNNGKANISSGNNGNGDFGTMQLQAPTGSDDRIDMGFAGTTEQYGFISIWKDNGGGTDEYSLMNVVEGGPGGALYGSLFLKDDLGNSVAVNGYGDIAASGDVSGNTLTSSDGMVQTSDARFKKNVETIENALDKTSQLRGVTYKWNKLAADVKSVQNGDDKVGVIAQELEKVFPELVKTGKDGYKAVDYASLTAVLIEAIKELNAEVKTLKAENNELKSSASKTAELSKRIETIEKLLELKAESSTSSAKN